ncbi:MAG: hypothetical protein GEV03_09000 [Streptosporangiales bacterium]|nr:hypothetical protein [Streptosporangiales bacterium]
MVHRGCRLGTGPPRRGENGSGTLGPVLRKLLGLAVVAAALTACGQTPVKMGAAAIVDDERITTVQVQEAVRSFQEAHKRSPVPPEQLRLPDPQSLTRSELMLLLRFRIVEQAAEREGISVSEGEIDSFIAEQGSRRDLEMRAMVGGIPPDLLREAVREALIQEQLAGRLAPDADPTQAAPQVQRYLVDLARDLGVRVSPRYGRFDYSSLTVVAADDTLSRPESQAGG